MIDPSYTEKKNKEKENFGCILYEK